MFLVLSGYNAFIPYFWLGVSLLPLVFGGVHILLVFLLLSFIESLVTLKKQNKKTTRLVYKAGAVGPLPTIHVDHP